MALQALVTDVQACRPPPGDCDALPVGNGRLQCPVQRNSVAHERVSGGQQHLAVCEQTLRLRVGHGCAVRTAYGRLCKSRRRGQEEEGRQHPEEGCPGTLGRGEAAGQPRQNASHPVSPPNHKIKGLAVVVSDARAAASHERECRILS